MPNQSRQFRPKIGRRAKVGAKPGTLAIDKKAEKPIIEAICYDALRCETIQIESPSEVVPLLSEWTCVWVNVWGLGDADVIRQLGEVFQIHPLALEDVVHVHQRAKVDLFDNLLFMTARMAQASKPFSTEQISVLLGKGFVVTFQERVGDVFDPIRKRLKQKDAPLRKNAQIDYLAYRIIDAVIDSFFPLMEDLGSRLDDIDAEVTSHPSPAIIGDIHQLKGDLLLARRSVWPHRDAVNQLARDDTPFVSKETQTFFRDVYDHTVQLIDLAETYRDICGDLRDYYMTAVSNRMNEVMKVLTVISTIFIPLSFVVGLYGMNFNTDSPYNMPELSWNYGYLFVWSVMGTMVVAMLLFFYNRGWLKTDSAAEVADDSGVEESE